MKIVPDNDTKMYHSETQFSGTLKGIFKGHLKRFVPFLAISILVVLNRRHQHSTDTDES